MKRPAVAGAGSDILAAGLVPPEMLTLMITNGCNLQCGHCWLECDPVDRGRPVPAKTIVRIIQDFDRLGGAGLTITGGEPMTHPEWLAILRFACQQTTFGEVCLQTNATLLDPQTVRALAALPSDRFVLQLSLEGASAASHDRVRGNGSFRRTLEGLALLAAVGMQRQVRVAFTEMAHNMEEIGPLVELLAIFGVSRLVGAALVMGGRAALTRQFRPPFPDQCRRLVERYEIDGHFQAHYRKFVCLAPIEWHKGRSQSADRICSCLKTPFIDASGRFYPCVMLQARSFSVGGAHVRPLDEVIRVGLPRWATLVGLSRYRTAHLELCRSCPGRDHCGGGCLGRAHAVHGNLMAADDRCPSRRAVYAWDRPSKS